MYRLVWVLALFISTISVSFGADDPAWPEGLPRHLDCNAAMERTCSFDGCIELADPPMAVTVDLLTSKGDFCLYTFCGRMTGALSYQGDGAFNGPIDVLATINETTDFMSYRASFDAEALTFAVFEATGDQILSYSGQCGIGSPVKEAAEPNP